MDLICINTRDELNLIDLDLIACIQANGNYSNIMYIDGNKLMVGVGLSQIEGIIKEKNAAKALQAQFVRLGRSIIVNNRYLSQINLPKQKLILSDRGKHAYQLSLPKQTLKNYKDLVCKQYVAGKNK